MALASPNLLFSSYEADISFDLTISNMTLPGIAVPAKVLLAKISDELTILMLGIIGHPEPIFNITDLGKMTYSIDATTLGFILHLVDLTASGTLFHIGPGIFQTTQPSVHLRIGCHNQTAFWAFSFLLAQESARTSATTNNRRALSIVDHQNIIRMLDFFKGDQGPEVAMGDKVLGTAPPQYAGNIPIQRG